MSSHWLLLPKQGYPESSGGGTGRVVVLPCILFYVGRNLQKSLHKFNVGTDSHATSTCIIGHVLFIRHSKNVENTNTFSTKKKHSELFVMQKDLIPVIISVFMVVG